VPEAATPSGPRVLILGLNYAPEPIGIGAYTSGLAQGLARLGFVVDVISGVPYYPAWQVYPGFSAWRWQSGAEHGVRVTRCPIYVPARPGGLRRILHLASFSLSSLPAVLARSRRTRPDVVVCPAPSLLSIPIAWLGAKMAGARLWIHVQDFEVEAAFATGLMRERSKLAKWARKVENSLLRLGDRVSSISPQMCRRLLEKGVAPEKVRELRNWANVPQIDPAGGEAYRAEWSIGEKAVALYSGNIANKQGIEIIIDAARLLQERTDLLFLICGEGPNRQRLEAMAKGLPNVRFEALQPTGRLGELLALASVHLLPQIAGAADLVLPSKLTNMLESGRPVVATAVAGTGLYEEVDGCGLLVDPGDAQGFAEAIGQLVDNAELARQLGENGRRRSRERWREEVIIARFADEFRAVSRGAAAP